MLGLEAGPRGRQNSPVAALADLEHAAHTSVKDARRASGGTPTKPLDPQRRPQAEIKARRTQSSLLGESGCGSIAGWG